MIAGKKRGQTIKRSVRIRISRPAASSFALYRQGARRRENLSEDFLRLMIRLLAVSFLVVFALGNLLHWHIGQEKAVFDQLMAVRADLSGEHAELLAQRNKLTAKGRIVAVAAVRLELYLPKKEQEHRLY